MSDAAITVNQGQLQDALELAEIGQAAFKQTYGPYNTPADLKAHLRNTYALEVVQSNLQSLAHEYAIARVGQSVAGFGLLAINSPDKAVVSRKPAEIKHLYVLEQFQRLRLGWKMMDHLRETAKNKNCDSLWLGVWEKADWARRFYARYGLVEVGTVDFLLGSDRQTDIVMSMQLSAENGHPATGG